METLLHCKHNSHSFKNQNLNNNKLQDKCERWHFNSELHDTNLKTWVPDFNIWYYGLGKGIITTYQAHTWMQQHLSQICSKAQGHNIRASHDFFMCQTMVTNVEDPACHDLLKVHVQYPLVESEVWIPTTQQQHFQRSNYLKRGVPSV